ncbi:MAG TPA: phosphatase PAP2 family protein [Chloroflexota bacterium]|nr:phosphatase PAP2 family protein [Chloroflexota bacterium]
MARAASRLVLALAALHLGAAAIVWLLRGPLEPRLAALDQRALTELTARFEPALAPGLLAALGPQGAVYPVLAGAALLGALVGRWRSVPLVALSLALCLALTAELTWMLGRLADHAAPLVAQPALPVPAEWRGPWQDGNAFPSRHALLMAALGATLVRAWPPLVLIGCPVALVSAAVPVYFGAAWASDALTGLVLGLFVAEAARFTARQAICLAIAGVHRLRRSVARSPALGTPLRVA